MKSLKIKLITGSGAVATIGGTGYLISALTDNKDTIENYLKKSSLELVSQEITSTPEWNKAFKTYEVERDEEDLKITDKEIKNGEDIKEWCKDAINKSIKSTASPLYKKFSYWCTKYKTVSEQLGDKHPFEERAEQLNAKYSNLPEPFKSEIEKVKLRREFELNENIEKIKQWCNDNKWRKFDKRNEAFIEKITAHCLINPTKLEI